MRADICEHAAGALLPRLAADNIEIPLQERPSLTGDRAPPHPQHGDCPERFEQLHAEQRSSKREMAILEAEVAFLAHALGYTPEQVRAGAVQRIQARGADGISIPVSRRINHAPTTPLRNPRIVGLGKESPDEAINGTDTRVSLAAKFMGVGVQMPVSSAPLPHPGTIPHWVVSRQHTSSVQGIPSAQWGTEAGQPSKAAAAQGVKAGEGGVDEDLETATYTGVTIEKATGKWGAKILSWDGDKRRQHRLGAYTTPKEAAVAFAAAAHVLRHGEEIENTIPLTDAQKALLEGCDKDAVVKLVGARMWWRWKKWRQVVQELDSKKRRQRKAPSANTRGKKRRVDGKVAGGGGVEATGSDVAEESEGLETTEATQPHDSSDAEESESAETVSKGESDEGQAKTKTVDHVLSGAPNTLKEGNDKPAEVEEDDPLVAFRASPEGSRNPTEEVTVSRAVFDSLKRAQDDNAKTVARLEEMLLKALATGHVGSRRQKAEKQRDPGLGCANPKRRRVEARSAASDGDEDDESDDSRRRHMRSSRSPVLQSALDLLPADKAWKVTDSVMYWEERKGRLSNSAGGNGHVVNGLKVLAKGAVERAIGVFNPEWDAERHAWIWGRHGMLLSVSGLEGMRPAGGSQAEDLGGDDEVSVSFGDE
ncbi:unnamed protein product [Closterium sp. Naga37s-1]|nr:unnamed protein product [Closterium sp. Naga37s-1]